MSLSDEQNAKERRILMAMRKTLASIVRDLTPANNAMSYPLTDTTVESVKVCFDLIAARERELAAEAGVAGVERPHFIDEPSKAQVISIDSLKNSVKKAQQESS